MDTVHWLATLFGPLLIIRGVWSFVFANKHAKHTMKSHEGCCSPLGFFNLVLGLLILSLYSQWSFTMPVLLTLLGWFFVIRAIMILFVPHMCEMKKAHMHRLVGIIFVIWGCAIASISFSS